MFGGLDFSALQRQAKEMKGKLDRIEADLAERVVEATAGGGMVKARANGVPEIVDVKIDPQVLAQNDKAMLEDLVIAAANEALKKARKMRETEMAKAMGGMGLPPGLV